MSAPTAHKPRPEETLRPRREHTLTELQKRLLLYEAPFVSDKELAGVAKSLGETPETIKSELRALASEELELFKMAGDYFSLSSEGMRYRIMLRNKPYAVTTVPPRATKAESR